MRWFYLLSAVVLLSSVLFGLIRIARGPTPADRMLSVQLFGTSGVATLLLLAEGMQLRAARDVALVFAILAVVATLAFVQRVWVHVAEDESMDGSAGLEDGGPGAEQGVHPGAEPGAEPGARRGGGA